MKTVDFVAMVSEKEVPQWQRDLLDRYDKYREEATALGATRERMAEVLVQESTLPFMRPRRQGKLEILRSAFDRALDRLRVECAKS